MILYILIIILVAINLGLWWWVVLPVQRLSKIVTKLTNQDLSQLDQVGQGAKTVQQLQRALVSMANHIAREQVQQRAYTDALTTGQEAERSRLARELHDDTIQSLIAIGQKIDLTAYWLTSSPEQAQTMLKAARDHINESVANLRNLITDLRPPALEELGLVPTLAIWGERLAPLTLQVEIEGTPRRLPEQQELTLFRCAQEAISNAQRHGAATHIDLKINYLPDGTRLSIQDNGQGFQIPDDWQDLASQGHFGLIGMRERLQHLQGRASLKSKLQQGTELDIFIPLETISLPENIVIDPVCHAHLEPHQVYTSHLYQGEWFYFCCPVCHAAFQANPSFYL